jgi:hypothetical protein
MAPLAGAPQALWQSVSWVQVDGQVFPAPPSSVAPPLLPEPPLLEPPVGVPPFEPPVGVPPFELLPDEFPVRLLSDPDDVPLPLSSKFEAPLLPPLLFWYPTSAPFFEPEPQAIRIAAAPTQTIDFAAMTRSLRCVRF